MQKSDKDKQTLPRDQKKIEYPELYKNATGEYL